MSDTREALLHSTTRAHIEEHVMSKVIVDFEVTFSTTYTVFAVSPVEAVELALHLAGVDGLHCDRSNVNVRVEPCGGDPS